MPCCRHGGESIARACLAGGDCPVAESTCAADSSCVAYACADSWMPVLYTSIGCTTDCPNMARLDDPSLITQAGWDGVQTGWSIAVLAWASARPSPSAPQAACASPSRQRARMSAAPPLSPQRLGPLCCNHIHSTHQLHCTAYPTAVGRSPAAKRWTPHRSMTPRNGPQRTSRPPKPTCRRKYVAVTAVVMVLVVVVRT